LLSALWLSSADTAANARGATTARSHKETEQILDQVGGIRIVGGLPIVGRKQVVI